MVSALLWFVAVLCLCIQFVSDESPLSSKAYVSGGNLIIPDASPSDEGVYGCIAKTSDRRVTLSANLIVDCKFGFCPIGSRTKYRVFIGPPVIVKPPEETHRFRGESWRFNCYTSAKPVSAKLLFSFSCKSNCFRF